MASRATLTNTLPVGQCSPLRRRTCTRHVRTEASRPWEWSHQIMNNGHGIFPKTRSYFGSKTYHKAGNSQVRPSEERGIPPKSADVRPYRHARLKTHPRTHTQTETSPAPRLRTASRSCFRTVTKKDYL